MTASGSRLEAVSANSVFPQTFPRAARTRGDYPASHAP